MASSTSPSGTTLLPRPTPTPLEVPRGHGMRFFWSGVVLIVALTAALGTWTITQPDNDAVVGSSTSAVTGQLSPNAADYRDARIQLQSSTTTSGPVSPNAADYRDGQSSTTNSGPVSPNAADYRDAQIRHGVRQVK